MINTPQPFIKWVGGKRSLLGELHQRLPAQFGSYFEPFIGGGALLFSLAQHDLNRLVINDYNAELTNLYQVVKTQPDELIEHLGQHINDEDYYYRIRALDREAGYQALSTVARASRFIYLNKTGYNGLYRVNKKGQNNVPFGRYKAPNIVDAENILRCSKFLQGVEIATGDFEQIGGMLDKQSFVYFDPPYAPLSATSSFTGYTSGGFDADMQVRLRDFCNRLDAQGVKFMLSNSSAPLIYDLYRGYKVEEVMVGRAINCKGDGRGKVAELIVRNY